MALLNGCAAACSHAARTPRAVTGLKIGGHGADLLQEVLELEAVADHLDVHGVHGGLPSSTGGALGARVVCLVW